MKIQERTIFARKFVVALVPLATLLLVFLVSSQFQLPAYSQGLASTPPAMENLASTPTPTPCPVHPPTGDRVKLRSEDEVVIAARHWHDDYYLRNLPPSRAHTSLRLRRGPSMATPTAITPTTG